MLSKISLEAVKQQFEEWRASGDKNRQIPSSLWKPLSLLEGQYKKSEILKILGISSYQLNMARQKWMSQEQALHSENAIPFVSIPLPMNPVTDPPPSIELIRPNGTLLRFLNPDQQMLSVLLQSFLG